ncbi:glycosyltransferase family 4 protein [Microbulbifer celer]|uniref:Glycosyltransferase family 4 protein n=1 Tax=Microbulbifer celer TaxID=435905 RepID=A0ABW3UA02_9GAMM|nr:glycosyltransferase family 4 protein [Microbulbifer celer]UFN57451.1 glycosyltransferase family 4 protein [Microbulbifer celer]
MKIVQLLPALNSGGVERGTLDLARALVKDGHESIVISSGGRLVEQLALEGSTHILRAVHRKSLTSLAQVRPLRKLIRELQPDILHVRSRVPAWLTWLAWRKLDPHTRPRLVSTAHGLYSINRYSAIMARSEQTIAISRCVKDYLQQNYARYLQAEPEIIYRGVDTEEFNTNTPLPENWLNGVCAEFPALTGKKWLLLPARLTRWKGQEDFIHLIAELVKTNPDAGNRFHGVILGGAEKNKEHFAEELQALAAKLGVTEHISFVGQRSDVRHWYRQATLVYNLSRKPEPFGRTVIEACAVGTPVIGYDIGGPAESLQICFAEGLVENGNAAQLRDKTRQLLDSPVRPELAPEFTLAHQAEKTMALYRRLLAEKKRP